MRTLIYCIHTRLVLKANPEMVITRKELITILGRDYHIPREMREKFIKELKEYKIIIDSSKGGNYQQGYYIINKHLKA